MSWKERAILVAEDQRRRLPFCWTAPSRKPCLPNPVRRVRSGQEAIHYLSGASPYSGPPVIALPCPVRFTLLDLKMPNQARFHDVLGWMRQRKISSGCHVMILSSSQQAATTIQSLRPGSKNGFNGQIDLDAGFWFESPLRRSKLSGYKDQLPPEPQDPG